MKKSIVICVVLFFNFGCKKDNNHSGTFKLNCGYSTFIDTNYRIGAKFLLITEIIEQGTSHPNYNNPNIDSNDVNTILSALQKIYDLNTPESDTVFNYYAIRVFWTNSLNSLSIKVNPNLPEVRQLIQHTPTTNNTLNDIINTYEFTADTSIFYSNSSPFILLNSNLQLNLIPIINRLKALPFFTSVQYNAYGVGDGNKIIMKRNNNEIEFDFSYGSGDCPSGCINRRHWVFKVDENCVAKFLRRY